MISAHSMLTVPIKFESNQQVGYVIGVKISSNRLNGLFVKARVPYIGIFFVPRTGIKRIDSRYITLQSEKSLGPMNRTTLAEAEHRSNFYSAYWGKEVMSNGKIIGKVNRLYLNSEGRVEYLKVVSRSGAGSQLLTINSIDSVDSYTIVIKKDLTEGKENKTSNVRESKIQTGISIKDTMAPQVEPQKMQTVVVRKPPKRRVSLTGLAGDEIKNELKTGAKFAGAVVLGIIDVAEDALSGKPVKAMLETASEVIDKSTDLGSEALQDKKQISNAIKILGIPTATILNIGAEFTGEGKNNHSEKENR